MSSTWQSIFGQLREIVSCLDAQDVFVSSHARRELLKWVIIHGKRPEYETQCLEYVKDHTIRLGPHVLEVHGPFEFHAACTFLHWMPISLVDMYHPEEVLQFMESASGTQIQTMGRPRLAWSDLQRAGGKLVHLNCQHVYFGPDALNSFRELELVGLKSLSIDSTNATNMVAIRLLKCSVLGGLDVLSVCDNALSDDFIDAVLESSLLDHISKFDVSGNALSFDAISRLLADTRVRGIDVRVFDNHMAPEQQERVNLLAQSLKGYDWLNC